MKKIVSLLAVLSLAVSAFTQTVIAADYDGEENEETVFLSLTKTAEPLKNLTTNLTVITEEEIKEKNAHNLAEVLEGETDVFVKSYGGLGQSKSVFMRGSNSKQVLVLIDGRPVSSVDTTGVDFDSIPANMIEKVEIIRGSGAAIYGTGAFGGVINVITKKATPLTPNVNPYFSYGTFNTINAGVTGAYANDVVSILVTPSLLSSDGYRPNSFYDSKSIFGKIAVNITENSEFVVSGQAYNADIGNPGSLSSPSLTDKMLQDRSYLKADYLLNLEKFKIQLSGWESNSARQANSWGNWYYYYNEDTGAKATVSYDDIIFAGIDYSNFIYENKDTYKEVRAKTAGYVQGFINVGELTLIPAVRYEMISDVDDDIFTPALSAIYKLTDEIKFSGNISKVWNEPDFDQLYFPYMSNPDLKPEEGVSSDIGVEYSKNNFSAAVTGFYITSKNYIVNDRDYIPQNVPHSRQYGAEFVAKYDMCKEISHKLNYTYTRAENTETHQNLVYAPLHNLNYAITVKPVKALKISADVSYVTSTMYQVKHDAYTSWGTYYPAEPDLYLDDYCIVNARVDYQINKYVSLWVKGDNLTNNDKYQLSYGYPMPGITGTAGIDVRF
jgi:outer membrane cobalamin receptor